MARKPKTLAVRRRRYAKKYMRKKKITRFATTKMIYKATLREEKAEITVPIATTTQYYPFVFQESLSDLVGNDIAGFAALYDEFKITGFTWNIRPRGNYTTSAPSDPETVGTLNKGFQYYSVLDHSDVNTLADPNEALEFASCKIHNTWKPASRYVPAYMPRLTHDVNNNPMIIVDRPKWLQMDTQTIGGVGYDQTLINHIGCKLLFESNFNSDEVVLDLYVKIHVQFRNKK